MKKITSFCINHDILKKGLFVSRVDKDIVTYDMRMVIPNCGSYLDNDGLHTFEHLLATYLRNSRYEDAIIYVGPMGCRTGFYLLTRDSLSKDTVIALVKDACAFIAAYEGAIPGAQTSAECGNYLDHNLTKAKIYAKEYGEVIETWTIDQMVYPSDGGSL